MKLLKSFTTILRLNSSLLSPACARNETHALQEILDKITVRASVAINPRKYILWQLTITGLQQKQGWNDEQYAQSTHHIERDLVSTCLYR